MKSKAETYKLFSGGEVHCKVIDMPSEIIVTDYTMNGFMMLAQNVEIYRRAGKPKIHVTYPYFPYARQDRVMVDNEPFSLKTFCDMVNALKLDSVTIWDPHSDVTPALLNNCKVIPQWDIARQCMPQEYFSDKNVMFVSPDAGAYKKVSKLIADDKRIAIGVKNRNPSGQITHTGVFYHGDLLVGQTCVMVDDICDGGRTFIALAKQLRAEGASKVHLYVTHGIFSNGFEELKQHIDHIYTTNSFTHEPQPKFLYTREII